MEAVTMVGGALLAPLFQSLLDALKSSDLLTYARESKVLDELNKWEPMLRTFYAVLHKAEEQQMTDQLAKSWFNDLRNLAYDVEDILDEFNTEAMRRKFRVESKASSSKVQKLLSSSVAGLSLSSSVKFSAGMVSKMKNISERLEDMIKRKDILKLSGSADGRNNRVEEERLTLPTTSLMDEAQVHGREKDCRAILELMKREAGDGGISVIPIVGMGGVGKTTLAQLVYNDASLQFDFKAWVSVGEVFDVLTVTKTVLQPQAGDDAKDLNSVQLKLKEKLSRKKFLVVLDDLWSEDYNKWTLFYSPFDAGAPGSRIIITTRNQTVSSMTSGGDGYRLDVLPDDVCLSIFAHHAFGRKDFSEHLHLKDVGEQVVKKCDGLPLAAKALGGLLRGVASPNAWEQVLKNNLWGEKSRILPALRLSYYYLPSHLKRCFGYCAIFPKEYEFRKDDLAPLWLAEGFIEQLSEGYEYFDELYARSLFQQSANDVSIFLMHDLVNDLARSVNGGVCFNLDEEIDSRKSYLEMRHSAFNRRRRDVAGRFENFQEMKCLRTFLALPVFKEREIWDWCYISSKVLDVWIPGLRCLRVLSLSGYQRAELPKSISVLQHLRYLNLSDTEIEILPECLSELFNLQILILCNCRFLRKLPEDFCNLINLQCLDIRGTDRLEEMPLHFGKLTNLHILSKFIVGNADGRRITELLKICNLRGQIHITELQNVINMEVIDCMTFRQNGRIDGLVLEWNDNLDEENEKHVLDALQPQKNIARVSIVSYGGTEFPSWLGNDSFNNMTFLEISKCRKVSSLPQLGRLPSLKELSIKGMSGIKEVGMDFFGDVSSSCADVFPSLETLKINNMAKWKRWFCYDINEDKGLVFPKLKILRIINCPEFIGDLPKRLPALQQLYIDSCPMLEVVPETLPSLQQLYIDSCPMLEVVPETLPSLGELEIRSCKAVVLKSLPLGESLTKLEISNISGLMSFDGVFLEALISLQEMKVRDCGELKHLWKDRINVERLGCLKRIHIWDCKELASLVEGEEGILPPNLQVLNIWDCTKLEKLPNQLHSLTSLTDLFVRGCSELVTFPTRGLPSSVKRVIIKDCDSLERLPEGIIVDDSNTRETFHIEELTISKGTDFIISSNGVFPTSLRFLDIWNGMEAQLLGSLQIQNHLSHLTSLLISDCSELESFPDTGLPIPTLSSFTLWSCGKLRCLPNNMHDLTSLQDVQLFYCPEIESFPERGLPPNLTQLGIRDCDKLERHPLSQWRLNALTYLQTLIIDGAMELVSSFPNDSLPLPTSLTNLQIGGFRNLKSISSGLQRLTSLQVLQINSCGKLRSLPKKGLPPSLGGLWITNCPLLRERCRKGEGGIMNVIQKMKGKGNYWARIAHIPRIHMPLD